MKRSPKGSTTERLLHTVEVSLDVRYPAARGHGGHLAEEGGDQDQAGVDGGRDRDGGEDRAPVAQVGDLVHVVKEEVVLWPGQEHDAYGNHGASEAGQEADYYGHSGQGPLVGLVAVFGLLPEMFAAFVRF